MAVYVESGLVKLVKWETSEGNITLLAAEDSRVPVHSKQVWFEDL